MVALSGRRWQKRLDVGILKGVKAKIHIANNQHFKSQGKNNMEKITVKTAINDSIEKVWKYFTETKYIKQWNSPSDDWHTTNASNNLIIGGNFSYTMATKDGSLSFDFAGVYDDIKETKYISYTLGDGRKVEVFFVSNGNRTEVTETFETEEQNPTEMQRAGWQAILDNFKKLVESRN